MMMGSFLPLLSFLPESPLFSRNQTNVAWFSAARRLTRPCMPSRLAGNELRVSLVPPVVWFLENTILILP